jgi:hypothetical protein
MVSCGLSPIYFCHVKPKKIMKMNHSKTLFQTKKLSIKYLLLIVIITLSSPIFAQSSIELSGQIKDNKSGENLIYCSVAVLNTSDSLITGGITNDKGYFNIPVNSGNYKLVYSYMGYMADTVAVGQVQKNRFLGIFKMEKDLQSLDEVEIKASSRESTIDKDIQIITDKMRNSASDAKEVLENMPGLSYDRYNNTISVDNSSQVIFLVEGVEKNQEFIKNLSPERMKKVEVIRNPGGRYGLEGYTAIINIILRKDYVGQEFLIYDQMLFDADQKNSSYLFPINSLNVTYNYSLNKLNLYAGITNHLQKFALNTNTETIYDSERKITESSPDNDPNMLFNNQQTSYTIGADYYINPRNTISFESNVTNFPPSNQQMAQTMLVNVFNHDELINSYQYRILNNKKTNEAYNSLFYIGKLSNKDKLEASFSFNNYHEEYDNKTTNDDLSWRLEEGFNNKTFTRFSIEYNHDFSSKLSTQVGYGNTWKELDNEFSVSESDIYTDTTSLFHQTEIRNNLYAYTSYTINKKLGVKAGLAIEYSNPVTDDQNHKYLIYQPYVDVKYQLNKLLSLKLMYRADADYPTISQTNPFSIQTNPTTINKGNPDLQPSVTHKVSLKLSAMQGLFSLEPYYNFSNNYISQTGVLRPDGVFEYTYNNIGHYEDKGIQANFTVPIGKLFVWQNSVRIYNSKITHDDVVNSFTDWKANSQFVFRGLKNNGVIVLNYRRDMSRNINAMGYSRNNNDYWLLLVQQPFFKNRLTAMAGYMLPVNWGVNYKQGNYAKANGYEKYSNVDISVLKNMFIFKLTYRFSKGKVKKYDKHIETESEEKGGGIF